MNTIFKVKTQIKNQPQKLNFMDKIFNYEL